MSSLMAVRAALWAAIFMTVTVAVSRADDWPEIRGKGRLGVWNETGILDKFPEGGLKVLWRTPIRAGYSGPAVADGRVFVLDYVETQRPRGTERAVALDQKTGKILWTREWQADYRGISWPVGPRATPTIAIRRAAASSIRALVIAAATRRRSRSRPRSAPRSGAFGAVEAMPPRRSRPRSGPARPRQPGAGPCARQGSYLAAKSRLCHERPSGAEVR